MSGKKFTLKLKLNGNQQSFIFCGNEEMCGNIEIIFKESFYNSDDKTTEPNQDMNRLKKIMRNKQKRLDSFKNWPISYISKEEMADAGFYYLNNSDRVRCFTCDGVIHEWEHGDIPIEEHKRHFPNCRFLITNSLSGVDTVD
ncbi:baculoviral IAP repeat-containing protein 2-like isoform X2 [Dinothrombium tinctorium]|uniref:Baculoviral IAP repeat-containing protein 2-like isoform X2 n=1 Tax=Dinothrombium tinctorium TaxID=1965070 RepID=A0A3S3S0N7_9ACAR|nr:baculoviral IAP repeat-containing protein 2-like isoform X2 [Dinothrombium tinctorium]